MNATAVVVKTPNYFLKSIRQQCLNFSHLKFGSFLINPVDKNLFFEKTNWEVIKNATHIHTHTNYFRISLKKLSDSCYLIYSKLL